jgi:hypothetical protein
LRFAAKEIKMRQPLFVLAALLTTSPIYASAIGDVRAKPPEFTAQIGLKLFDIERCIIDVDNIGNPWVYRQPDRPDVVMFVWESSDWGDATVLEMKGVDSVSIKFWGRNKAWRKVQPCIGRSEADVK